MYGGVYLPLAYFYFCKDMAGRASRHVIGTKMALQRHVDMAHLFRAFNCCRCVVVWAILLVVSRVLYNCCGTS